MSLPEDREKACYAQLNAGFGQTEELEPRFSQLNLGREVTGAVGPNLEAAEEDPPRFVDAKCGPEVPIQPLSHPCGT